jgi:hypothetical protein
VKRILGIVLAVLLLGGVAVIALAGRGEDTGTATTTVRGVIGSEKAEFFADPDVVKALADKGLTVKAETSGSWAMDQLALTDYDFAFPGSKAPADGISEKSGNNTEFSSGTPIRPFYSPLVVVAHGPAAEVLAANGLAQLDGDHRGTLDMAAYLDAADKDGVWQDLKGADAYGELTGALFISSTSPETSNSGALYLAAASYVAGGGQVATDAGPTAPLMRKLIAVQGAQQTSSDGPFRDFISGVGNPLVLVYESQIASLLVQQQQVPDDLVVLYPDTTVNSDHTLVPLSEAGLRLGEALRDDERLRELAVRHGFRPQSAPQVFTKAVAAHTAYLNQEMTGVRQAPVPTQEVLHEIARRAAGN